MGSRIGIGLFPELDDDRSFTDARALKWWAENLPLAPTMLADELDEYLDRLLLKPDLGEPGESAAGRRDPKL